MKPQSGESRTMLDSDGQPHVNITLGKSLGYFEIFEVSSVEPAPGMVQRVISTFVGVQVSGRWLWAFGPTKSERKGEAWEADHG